MECTICYSFLSEPADCQVPKLAKRANGCAKGQGKGQLCCLPCGHVFHKYCVLNWMETNGKGASACPICRKALKETRQLKDVYLPTVDKMGELIKKNDKLEEEVKMLKKKVEELEEKGKKCEVEEKKEEEDNEVVKEKKDERNGKEEEKDGGGGGGGVKMDFLAAWNKWRNSN